jgi:hypothetical protein
MYKKQNMIKLCGKEKINLEAGSGQQKKTTSFDR